MLRHQLAVSAVLVAACHGDSVGPASQLRPSERPPALLLAEMEAKSLAAGLAKALRHEGLKYQLLVQMRRSDLTEHKLDLHQFSASPTGERLLDAAAQEMSISVTELRALIERLPPMDMYVPFETHRLAWSASQPLLVAATFDTDVPVLAAVDGDGQARQLAISDGTPQTALLILHPAEPRFVMRKEFRPGELREGAVARIQEHAGAWSARRAHSNGLSYAGAAANTCETCIDDGSGGGTGGGTGTVAGVYVTHFHGFREDGWGGDLEMEFRSFAYDGLPIYRSGDTWFHGVEGEGRVCTRGTVTLTVPPHTNWNGTPLLLSANVTSSNLLLQRCEGSPTPTGYTIDVVEMDGGFNLANDFFGRRFFVSGTMPFGADVGLNLEYANMDGTGFSPSVVGNMLKTEYR